MERDSLGTFEYEVLAVLMQEPSNSYGSSIRHRIKIHTQREPSVGALYTTLERLESKGFVTSWWGEATAERGGRRKRFYRIEAMGEDALRRTDSRRKVWLDFGGIVPVGG